MVIARITATRQKSKLLGLSAALLVLAGCMAHIVDDERVAEPMNAIYIDCDEEPYFFVRGCSETTGPSTHILLDEKDIRITANRSGDIVYFAPLLSTVFGQSSLDLLTLDTGDSVGEEVERYLYAIESELSKQDIAIMEIVPAVFYDLLVVGGTDTYGNILKLSGDGYSALSPLAVEDGK